MKYKCKRCGRVSETEEMCCGETMEEEKEGE
jgi:hypothetical protein